MSTPTKPFIIWVDQGLDGWVAREFDDLDQVRDFLLRGESYGSALVLTRLLKVTIGVNEA